MPRWGVACLRGCFVVLYLCTFIFPHASGYDDYPTRGYLRFFTNWGINLLCITGIIGLSIYVYECFFAQQVLQALRTACCSSLVLIQPATRVALCHSRYSYQIVPLCALSIPSRPEYAP